MFRRARQDNRFALHLVIIAFPQVPRKGFPSCRLRASAAVRPGKRRSQSDVHSDVMSVETFMQRLQALNSSLETLAAIGAELRLRRDGLDRSERGV